MYHIFIHSSINGYLGYFYILAIVNNSMMNMGIQVVVRVSAFNSVWYILQSGIAGSHSNCTLNLLEKHHTMFHRSCNISNSYQHCMWGLEVGFD